MAAEALQERLRGEIVDELKVGLGTMNRKGMLWSFVVFG